MNWFLIFAIIWYAIGLYCFQYWWRRDFDLTSDWFLIFVWLVIGLVGPIAWLMGSFLHGEPEQTKPVILLKKKK